MSAEPYTPRKGSIAELALQQLQARGPLTEDQLTAECDVAAEVLRSSTTMARRYGVIKVAKRGGALIWRAVADPTDVDPDDEVDDILAPVQRTVPAAGQRMPAAVLAVVRERRASPWNPVEKQEVVEPASGSPVDEDAMERAAQDHLLAPAARSDVGAPAPTVEEQLELTIQALRDALAERDLQIATLNELIAQARQPREVPCVSLTTVSFEVSPHVAERLCKAAAELTEVRS